MKNIKINFAPGAFDSFEGTQEELDELVLALRKMAETGEILDHLQIVDTDLEEDSEFACVSTNIRTLQ